MDIQYLHSSDWTGCKTYEWRWKDNVLSDNIFLNNWNVMVICINEEQVNSEKEITDSQIRSPKLCQKKEF
jgi:hypothetical protein